MPTAIVTGGNSGIGKATTVALAARGFDVGITWHAHEDTLAEVLDEARGHGARAEAAQVDADVVDARELPIRLRPVTDLMDRLGGVDCLVSNVGGGLMGPALELDLDAWLRTLNLNLTSAFLALQLAARRMVEQGRGGRLVAVTSVHEHAPLQDSTAYVAAKHGLGGVVKNMALELAPHGITVNAVAPGEIATRMTDQEDQDPAQSERSGVPLRRPGDAHEIAAAVAFLCDPDARYVTGHSLVVDGGMLLMGPTANQLVE